MRESQIITTNAGLLDTVLTEKEVAVHEVSCIIPFWNEGSNIFAVLDEVMKVSNLSEIICVDDASSDCNSEKILKYYPEVRLVRLDRNSGKSAAIRKGVRYAKGDYIIMIDADLQNLDHMEIENAIEAVLMDDEIDMLILRRVNALFHIKLYRADVLFTGERILKRSDLETVLDGPVEGWQLESAINTWMYMNGKKVFWTPHSAVNKPKVRKWGSRSWTMELKTVSDMITAAGFVNFARQVLFFARDRL